MAKAKSKAAKAKATTPKAKAASKANAAPKAKAKTAKAKAAPKAKAAKAAPKAKAAKAAPKAKAAKAAPKAKPATAKAPKAEKGVKLTAELRGEALVDLVVAKIEAEGGVLGGCGIPDHPAKGMAAEALAALSLPDGRPLPPSLRRFLAYDESYLGVIENGKLATRTFSEMMKHEFGGQMADVWGGAFQPILPGPCLVVPQGSDSRRFVYFGEPDAHGEYPVFVVDTDDVPYVCIAYPGLDVYLADGVIAELPSDGYVTKHKAYEAAMVDQARRNFHGFVTFDMQDPEHVDGPEAAGAFVESLIEGMQGAMQGAEEMDS